MKPARLQADLLLGLVSFIWGSTFVVVKDALADVSPLAFFTLRYVLACIVLLLVFRRSVAFRQPGLLRAALIIGLFLAAGYGMQTIGLQFTTPTKSAFITGLAVAVVPLLMAVVFGRPIGRWTAAGVLAAVAGLYLLAVPPGEAPMNRGDLLTVFAAVSFAGHIIAVGQFAPRYSYSALAIAQLAAALVFTASAMLVADGTALEPLRLAWTPRLLVALVITGVFATALAFTAQAWAQRHTTPTHTAILFSLEPVFAALTSFVVHGERLSGRSLWGAGLILAGILAVELKGPAPTAAELPVPSSSR